MANEFITTNITGVYVFENGKLKDSILFNLKDIEEINLKLRNHEWLNEEISLTKKYKDSIFIGNKKEKIESIKISQDPKKIQFIADYFSANKNMKQFKFINTILTKREVKHSTTQDLLIIQSIKSIDDLKKSSSMIIKRLRDWYEIYNPEYSARTQEHDEFVETILKKSKDQILNELNIKNENSMGSDLTKDDVEAILNLARQIEDIKKNIEKEEKYMEKLMTKTCPNIYAICGSLLGAKIIELAGGLRELTNFPAGTVQLLGAEKALFRHIRKGNKPPKHGYIITHPLVANATNKGKAARTLANKILIAAKVDYFKGEFVGDKLKSQLEKQLKMV